MTYEDKFTLHVKIKNKEQIKTPTKLNYAICEGKPLKRPNVMGICLLNTALFIKLKAKIVQDLILELLYAEV
jgi:hypothetical protein